MQARICGGLGWATTQVYPARNSSPLTPDFPPGGVDRKLADRDSHAAGTLVTKAQDPLVVGDHDQTDVEVGCVASTEEMSWTSSGVIQRPRGLRTIWL